MLVKIGKIWVQTDNLTQNELEKLGISEAVILSELKKVPDEIKTKPCDRAKKTKKS